MLKNKYVVYLIAVSLVLVTTAATAQVTNFSTDVATSIDDGIDWLDGAGALDTLGAFRTVSERIAWFVDFPTEAAAAVTALLTLWTVFTYVYPASGSP